MIRPGWWVRCAAPVLLVMPLHGQWFNRSRVVEATPAPGERLVAYTLRVPSDDGARFLDQVYTISADGGAATLVGEGRRPAFAPRDGALVRVVVRGDSTVLLVRQTPTDSDRVLAVMAGEITALRWSPAGQQLAFTADRPRSGGPEPWGDRNGRLALYVVSREGGVPRQLTPSEFRIGPAEPEREGTAEFDWLDEERLVVSGRAAGAVESPEGASLHIVEVATGTVRYLAGSGGRWHAPRVSPNGDWIAFIGQAITAPGWMAAELIVLRPTGTGLKRLTVGLDRDVADVTWGHDSRTIWYATADRGSRNLMRVELRSGRVQSATTGTQLLELEAIAERGDWALAIRHSLTDPGSLVRLELNRTHDFRFLVEPSQLPFSGEVEELDLRAADGTAVHAWLLRPPGFSAGRRAPLLIDIHGGPHAMAGAGYAPFALAHASLGWLVVRANPRGSTGFGYDLVNGLALRWPGQDVSDLQLVIDALVARDLVDTSRIAAVGSGAGGVTAVALRAADGRVRHTILRCTGGDWLPGGRGTDPPTWSEWFSARPYRSDPMRWWEFSSPRPGVATTPVLVIEGPSGFRDPVDYVGSLLADLDRRGVPATLLALDRPCHRLGPAAQQRVLDVEQRQISSVTEAGTTAPRAEGR